MNRSLQHRALADAAPLTPAAASSRGGAAAAPAAAVQASRLRAARRSRWPARLDLLQSASGLFLALFLIAHRRYRATHDTLTSSHTLRNGGRLVLTATVLSLLLAVVAAVLVAAEALRGIG